jgi:hypothetical protein
LYLTFDLNYDAIDSDANINLEIQTRSLREKKAIGTEYKSFKLNKGASTSISTDISIEDLVKDNELVNDYSVVIKYGNTVLKETGITLYIDYTAEKAFMDNVTVSDIKFYSGGKNEWIDYSDREYATEFKWSPVLGMVGTELYLTYDYCPDDYAIPIKIRFDGPDGGYAEFTPMYEFPQGSTANMIEGYTYFGQFDAKKFQPGYYIVTFYAFDKKFYEGKFSVE